MNFDFNSKDDFTPDNDSIKVASKFWTYFLNPVPLSYFTENFFNKGISLAIIRGHQETEEKGSDSDSYGSQDEDEAPRHFTYDQEEQLDNLVDSKMVLDFLNSGLDEKGQII